MTKKLSKNILIAYILVWIRFSWFWMGTWVFYYLRFTNYAGIGLIETILIITMTVSEIPTGAIADLLGKRFTLIVSNFIQFAGSIYMALAGNFFDLAFSVFLLSVGATLYSGTLDALVYDSLKEEGKEDFFDKVISNISSIQLIAVMVSGLLSGIVYSISPSLPYFLSAVLFFIGFILAFFLREPKIDTVRFSVKEFLRQTKQGFKQLFNTNTVRKQIFLLLSVMGFLVIADEMGESFLGVEFGFKENSIGVFFSLAYLVAALTSQLTPKIIGKINTNKLVIILGILTAISFIISPFVGLIIGAITIVIRQVLATTFNNLSSIAINRITPSKYRATTISSFNMVKNLPYVVGAYFIGHLMDTFSARKIFMYIGLLMLLLLLSQIKIVLSKNKQSNYLEN